MSIFAPQKNATVMIYKIHSTLIPHCKGVEVYYYYRAPGNFLSSITDHPHKCLPLPAKKTANILQWVLLLLPKMCILCTLPTSLSHEPHTLNVKWQGEFLLPCGRILHPYALQPLRVLGLKLGREGEEKRWGHAWYNKWQHSLILYSMTGAMNFTICLAINIYL